MTDYPDFSKTDTTAAEFSRRAETYQHHNIIQRKVVKHLIAQITSQPSKILDLGCGSGAVYNLIDWKIERFVGIDKADMMCRLHPQSDKIELFHDNFENLSLLQKLGHFDIVISSSALQWANDLESLFQTLHTMTDEIAFAIFCNGTFKTIYEMTQLESFLPSKESLQQLLEKYFDCQCEIKNYTLEFQDNISKFRYIKRSGVSGGKKRLSVQETRSLIRNYPFSYLEFEVLFCFGKPRR